jgi:uncharacterized protein
MELVRQDNIIAIKTRKGRVVGFHAHNLQVAELDAFVWQALRLPELPTVAATNLDEARQELKLWNDEVDEAVSDAQIAKGFRSLAINVAQLCNLKCTYCAAGGDGTFGEPMKQVDLGILNDQIRMLLHDVPNGGEFRFTFLGGEPLLAPEALRAIHRYSKLQVAGRNIRLRYDIVTNGTLVTPEIAELLASMACNVTVSLDGPKEVNDISRPTRGGKGSTDRTLAGVRNLLDVRDRLGSLSAGSVFGKHYTGVVETYKFLKSEGFERFRFDFAVGDQDETASRAYVEGIKAVADLAWAEGGEAELRKISLFDTHFQILDNRQRIRNHCGAGKTHLHTDTRGKLTTCQWFVGEKSEQVGSGTEIDHEALKAYADPLVDKHACNTCWARNICGGGCMYVNKTKTGSKHEKDSEFCFRTRSIIAKGIEYYAEARYQGVTQ